VILRRHNRPVAPLATDTAPDIERRQVAGWQTMTPAEMATTVVGLTDATFQLAAGVRSGAIVT
jgi:hypothetical protein